jgi:phage-related baseplate assembly protein
MPSTVIDLSRIPAPAAIEPLSYETLNAQFITRFKAAWAALRATYPELPDYDIEMLETDPAVFVGEAWAYVRLLDRARVNDGIRALLAPLAKKADLDNVVASVNIERLVITPATDSTPAVMETDEQLLRRYLLAYDRPSAGSADRYLYEAFTAWPQMHDAAVIGRGIHGRRGDTDIVIIGPNGDAPTTSNIVAVRDAVNATDVKPEATSVAVVSAIRNTYTVSLVLNITKYGPSVDVVVAEARARVDAAIADRLKIGAEAPIWSIAGAAYGPNVISVEVVSPTADIPPEPYTIPVCTGVTIKAEVQE